VSYVSELRQLVGHRPLQLPGTGVVVWRRNSNGVEVLIQLRSDHNKWGLLGGGIELGESYEECAIRELEEEAGLTTSKSNLRLMEVYAGPEHVTTHPNGDIVYHTVVVYVVNALDTIHTTNSKELSSESSELKWTSLDEVKKLLEEGEEKNFFHNNIPIFKDIVNKFFC
jgi:8-oxo-dGTP pyrophosphatase MutT (NUDIX family)